MSPIVIYFPGSDLLYLTLALTLGSLCIFLPGFAIGWWLNLLQFRKRESTTQWSMATVFGLTMTPILLYLTFKFLSGRATIAVVMLLAFAGTVPMVRRGLFTKWKDISKAAKIAVPLCILVGILFMLDLGDGNRLYPSWSTVDQSARTAMIVALARSDRPPVGSPLYSPGHSTALQYHYFLFLLGSEIYKLGLGFIPARITLSAISIWVGLGLLSLVAIFVECFGNFSNPSRVVRIAWFLLAVTGLDVIPVLAHMGFEKISGRSEYIYLSDVEWWNGNGSVSGWIDSLVWAPHHLAAMIACLLGCLLLWHSRCEQRLPKWSAIVAASLAFSSACGLSILIVIVFAIFLLLVVLELILNSPKQVVAPAVAGLLALVLVSPFLIEMQPAPGQPNSMVSAITIRQFQPVSDLYLALNVRSALAWNLSYLAVLPINYFLELGVFAVGGIWWLFKQRHSGSPHNFRNHMTAGLLAVTLLLTCFLRFGVSFSNDFGSRGMLPAQFVLLLWTAEWVDWLFYSNTGTLTPVRPMKRIALALVTVGILSNALGLILLRSRIMSAEIGKAPLEIFSRYHDEGQRMKDLVSAYEWIRWNSPVNAIVQENPTQGQTFMQSQYSERSTAIYFPIDQLDQSTLDREYRRAFELLRPIFEGNPSRRHLLATCENLKIDYLIVQDTDPVWGAKDSYAWTETPVFLSRRVRVIECPKI